uniref:Uncharacterized protein n=1 Tax=Acrobeloides nanus TaxID=290746 RepID=A0A914E581_9BILA
MEIIREIGILSKEIGESTIIRMAHSCRGFYEGVVGECKQFDQVWKKKIKPKSEELKTKAKATLADNSPLDPTNQKKRNTCMEFYFGISILLLGLISGEYTGAMVGNLYSSSWFEVGLLFALPIYYWSKQSEYYDETKNRMCLFLKLFVLGALLGHVFPLRIMNTVPASIASLPFFFAVLLDPKLEFLPLYGGRKMLVGVATVITFSSCYMMDFMGELGFISNVFLLFHSALLYGHFSYLCAAMKNNELIEHEKLQLIYLFSLALVQLALTTFSFPATYHATVEAPTEHFHSEH